ncbi:MAG: Xaa-Pro peptidase family protein [Candidatus Omnitrophica bacterium]|nr:Xaa-Pro peptidase family protein [Candidatus Omnitrophota bacterium]
MESAHRRRRALLKKAITKKGLDSFLVTSQTNISYLSGFTGQDSMLLITASSDFFITDSRFIEDARDNLKGFQFEVVGTSTYETIGDIADKKRLRKMGFEAMDLPFEVVMKLRKVLRRCRTFGVSDLVESFRQVKDEAEIESIRSSIRLLKDSLNRLLSAIRPGVSEKSLARICESAFLAEGASAAFDPIVAAGVNASKPHARPTDEPIRKNSFVMIDIGCRLNGYCSDLTRMVVLGKVKEKFKKIYDTVRVAQEKAIDKVAPGVMACEVDRAARDYIEKQGFGKYFGHSVGHGVGMQVHEGPAISRANRASLRPGMVFTVEPAIYIPRFGGVRIEDMVLVTDGGCNVLTR